MFYSAPLVLIHVTPSQQFVVIVAQRSRIVILAKSFENRGTEVCSLTTKHW
jgi:hypothetical protein